MPHSPLELLRHILEEVDYISTTSKDLTKESFLGDETLKRSFVRSIEIIGEASNKIDGEDMAAPRAPGRGRGGQEPDRRVLTPREPTSAPQFSSMSFGRKVIVLVNGGISLPPLNSLLALSQYSAAAIKDRWKSELLVFGKRRVFGTLPFYDDQIIELISYNEICLEFH